MTPNGKVLVRSGRYVRCPSERQTLTGDQSFLTGSSASGKLAGNGLVVCQV